MRTNEHRKSPRSLRQLRFLVSGGWRSDLKRDGPFPTWRPCFGWTSLPIGFYGPGSTNRMKLRPLCRIPASYLWGYHKLDSRFNFRGSGKQGTCFQICLKQLRKALEIQGAISDFNLFWTAVPRNTKKRILFSECAFFRYSIFFAGLLQQSGFLQSWIPGHT